MLFTALLLVCNTQAVAPDCKVMSNPILYDNLDVCLRSVAEGITAFEKNNFKVIDYQCYEWTQNKDLNDLID